MTNPFIDRLEEARREAERRITDLDRKIKSLEADLEKAHEERKLYSFMAADVEHKLRSVRAFDGKDNQKPPPYRRLVRPSDSNTLINAAIRNMRTEERPPTMRDMVLSILSVMREGLDVNEIIDYMRVKFNAEVPRTSLSPQLSRMKAEDELLLEGDKWRLHPRLMRAAISSEQG